MWLLVAHSYHLAKFYFAVFRMCDNNDPAKAAELYISASEMNVVCTPYYI